jgi:hypothetical protein
MLLESIVYKDYENTEHFSGKILFARFYAQKPTFGNTCSSVGVLKCR